MAIIPPLELAFSFLCGFAAMPGGPFGRQFGDNGWFQLIPVNRGRGPCPDIIKRHDVTFQLYHGHDARRGHTLTVRDEPALKRSGFDPRLPTVVYIHGFLAGPDSKDVITMKNAYAARGDHNFIVASWRYLSAGPWYDVAVGNVVAVGDHVAQFLDFLTRFAGPLEDIHLIGHGLGAHVAGVAANSTTSARVNRITGLDPSLQRIGKAPINRRLDPADATFVDVIHTDGGIFGVSGRFGHADFYVNRGKAPQPGCELPAVLQGNRAVLAKVFCSHWRAYEMYAASVVDETKFLAMRCHSQLDYDRGHCTDPSEVVPMGYAVPNSAKGAYFMIQKRPVVTAVIKGPARNDLDLQRISRQQHSAPTNPNPPQIKRKSLTPNTALQTWRKNVAIFGG